MELTACGSRRRGERLRHCEKAAVERATVIRAELLEKGPQPRLGVCLARPGGVDAVQNMFVIFLCVCRNVLKDVCMYMCVCIYYSSTGY